MARFELLGASCSPMTSSFQTWIDSFVLLVEVLSTFSTSRLKSLVEQTAALVEVESAETRPVDAPVADALSAAADLGCFRLTTPPARQLPVRCRR